jgi:hypothetical protein
MASIGASEVKGKSGEINILRKEIYNDTRYPW